MDLKIFNNMDTYFDVYSCLAQKPRAKNELLALISEKGAAKSTAKAHVQKAEKGDLGFISVKNGLLCFDADQFKEMLSELCKEIGLVISFEEMHRKKPKPEDSIASVTVSHSPEYKKAKQAADSATATIRDLKKEISQKDDQIKTLAAELEKKAVTEAVKALSEKTLVIGTAQFKPDGVFEEDFFTNANAKLLDVSSLVSRFGNEKSDSKAEELCNENYLTRIAKILFGGNLLRNMLDEKEVSGGSASMVSDKEKERLESINQILKDDTLPNQVKLSLYAQWFKGDSEMQKLLEYAGDHCINANYVIRLMEKPKEYQNQKTMRGMMKQAMKASEAHIKKEAALELIAGEWYVEAEYDGEMTRFRMVPDSILERIKNTSLQYHGENLVNLIDAVLLENTGVDEGSAKKAERLYMNSNVQKEDIEVPGFVHAADGDVDVHVAVDEDVVMDDFEEVDADGED